MLIAKSQRIRVGIVDEKAVNPIRAREQTGSRHRRNEEKDHKNSFHNGKLATLSLEDRAAAIVSHRTAGGNRDNRLVQLRAEMGPVLGSFDADDTNLISSGILRAASK